MPKYKLGSKNKFCFGCKSFKLLEEFNIRRSAFSGRESWCRICMCQVRAETPKIERKAKSLHYNFKLDWADYLTLKASQEDRCAICGKHETERPLHTDHDHATGKVRGLLCGQCNRALGLVGDNPAILIAASDYLKQAQA